MNKKEILRHEFLKEELLKLLNSFNAGDKFLSVREIMERFSVSQATVDRTLLFFYESRMLDKMPGKGIFVSNSVKKFSPGLKTVGLELPDWPSENYHKILCSIREAAADSEFEIIPVYHQADNYKFELPSNIDAMLWYSVDAFIDPVSRKRLEELQIPLILICTPEYGISVDYVGDDEIYGGSLAASHLIDLGHKSLAILASEPSEKVVLRVRGFRQRCQLAGVPCRVIDCGTRPGEMSVRKAHDALKAEIAAGRLDFSGLFVVSDGTALGALSALASSGVSVPRDLSVMGYDGNPSCEFFSPPLSSVDTKMKERAPKLLELLRKRLAGPPGPPWFNVEVEPSLILRASTAAPKANA